jgi:hypothetical protein
MLACPMRVSDLEIRASHITLHSESITVATSEMYFNGKRNGVNIVRNYKIK